MDCTQYPSTFVYFDMDTYVQFISLFVFFSKSTKFVNKHELSLHCGHFLCHIFEGNDLKYCLNDLKVNILKM